MATAKEKRTQKRSVTFSVDMLEQLDKLAIRNRTTTSELVRGYVEKGLSIDGHKENIDLIATIVRQEVTSELDGQINRVAKMKMKVVKRSTGRN